jgi:hypothetical protein
LNPIFYQSDDDDLCLKKAIIRPYKISAYSRGVKAPYKEKRHVLNFEKTILKSKKFKINLLGVI